MSTAGVYKIKIGKFVYIGSSFNIKNRLNDHKIKLVKNLHKNPKLQNAFNKYGDFSFEILFEGAVDEILKIEQFYIDGIWGTFTCANLRPVTNSPLGTKQSVELVQRRVASRRGYRHSLETIERIRESNQAKHGQPSWGTQLKRMLPEERAALKEKNNRYRSAKLKGVPRTAEIKEKISNAQKGKYTSEAVRDKIRQTLTGFKHTEETKSKLSALRKGKPLSERNLVALRKAGAANRSKVVLIIFDKETQFVNVDLAAAAISVKKATLESWLCGQNPWPMEQKICKTKVPGLTGGYKIKTNK